MADTKSNKSKKSQIEQKDLADDVSKILGDEFEALKTKALKIGYEHLLDDNQINDIFEWHKRQVSHFGSFKLQIDKLIKSEKKSLQKAVVNGSKLVGLNSEQTKKLQKEVNKGVLQLGNAAIITQASNINQVKILATRVYKSNVTDALYNTISNVITKTNDYGIVMYKNGRQVKWENYMEMKVRTDIQNDIADNMVESGNENGVVFYIATYHGDCAPDHADYQGKIYCAKNWKTICPKEYLDEVSKYISSHKIMNVEDVMGPKGNYFTKRPNCRHYFQSISIQEVLNVTNDKELDNLREAYNLNSAGKYKPEKYEALKKQRYNERKIRKIKGEIEAQKKIMAKLPKDLPESEIIKHNDKLLSLKRELKEGQKEQRELLNANQGVLQRNYNREAYNYMISDFGIKKDSQKLNTEIENDIIKVEDISDPQYFDENCQLRDEYHDILSKIKQNLPEGTLRKQAEYAYNERDKARRLIRDKMHDKKAVNYLQLNKKPISFEDLIEHKKKKLKALGKDYTMDDVYKDIIETSCKSNETFDMLFKRSDKK